MHLDRVARVIPTGCLGNPKSLPDDFLKVRIHGAMRAQPAAKEKPRRSGNLIRSREFMKFARAVTSIATTGALASDNVLVPTTNPDYVELNTANFTMLVNAKGVAHVAGKPQGGLGHVGGIRLQPGSPELATFEAWLNLL